MSAPRIAILPPELASQIAAGEVIERPASVVKELAENALDAGARRIEVEIEGGGLQLVRVVDDGCGMTPEEAALSLERHATSKLRSVADLSALTSMGFRGEALPSIASVSRFVLTTRQPGAVSATRLTLEGGLRKEPPREAGAPAGTQIEVRDLLYNVPARLKFMKGEATETAHITEALLRLALAFPVVHFRLRAGTRTLLDLPPHPGGLERAQAALGGRGRRSALYPCAGEESGVKVEAYLGAPTETTNTPRNIYLFVNRRFIRDRSLLHALGMGYGEVLDRGRYPTAVLHLEVPPDEVDVNVHPQKLEVRFQKAQEVYAAVRHAVRRTVGEAPWLLPEPGQTGTLDLDPQVSGLQDEAGDPGPAGEAQPGAAAAFEERPSYSAAPPPLSGGAGLDEHRRRLQQALDLSGRQGAEGRTAAPEGRAASWPAEARAGAQGEGGAPAQQEPRRFFSQMTYLGQLNRTYLLCEYERELVLVDQHAAHERLAFERMRLAHIARSQAQAAQGSRGVRSQRLLLPLTLELDPQRAALCEDEHAVLESLGFEVRPFGGKTFAITAVPDAAEYGRGARVYQDPERLLTKVLDDLIEHGRSDTVTARIERVLATIACHSVVRAGDVLDEVRARALLSAMDDVEFFPYCPHGRPVLVRMPQSEIERRFGRI
jgi:DNA mismatch repair protein MutL